MDAVHRGPKHHREWMITAAAVDQPASLAHVGWDRRPKSRGRQRDLGTVRARLWCCSSELSELGALRNNVRDTTCQSASRAREPDTPALCQGPRPLAHQGLRTCPRPWPCPLGPGSVTRAGGPTSLAVAGRGFDVGLDPGIDQRVVAAGDVTWSAPSTRARPPGVRSPSPGNAVRCVTPPHPVPPDTVPRVVAARS